MSESVFDTIDGIDARRAAASIDRNLGQVGCDPASVVALLPDEIASSSQSGTGAALRHHVRDLCPDGGLDRKRCRHGTSADAAKNDDSFYLPPEAAKQQISSAA